MFVSRVAALCALLSVATASFVDEVQWNAVIPHVALNKRQSSSSPEIQKPGDNCTVAFGAGYETCTSIFRIHLQLTY